MARQKSGAQRKHNDTQAFSPISRNTEKIQTNEYGRENKLKGGLYLVATPIGNLGDISTRALAVLEGADVIACEDTRSTAKLLGFFNIRARLISYHDFSTSQVEEGVIAHLKAGEAVAVVSDAGMPLVSDPGFPLVRRCIAEGLPMTAVPGASAPLMALQLSGLPADRFFFHGFLPPRQGARRTALQEVSAVPGSLIFFESPRRLADSLADMEHVLGARSAAVCRELTKLFEEVRRGTLGELAAHYQEEGPPKGEVVVVVGPAEAPPELEGDDLDALVREALQTASPRDVATLLAKKTGLARRVVYARAIALSAEEGDEE